MGGCTATNRPERHILEQTADWNVNQFEMLTNIHFPRRRIVQFLLAASIGGSGSAFASSADDLCQASSDRVAWVAESLKRMLTIKPGMSRYQLVHVFTTEGGLFTSLERTFVSRDCPYFKVDVTFHRATGPSSDTRGKDVLRDLDNDVIASISRPYLEFSVSD